MARAAFGRRVVARLTPPGQGHPFTPFCQVTRVSSLSPRRLKPPHASAFTHLASGQRLLKKPGHVQLLRGARMRAPPPTADASLSPSLLGAPPVSPSHHFATLKASTTCSPSPAPSPSPNRAGAALFITPGLGRLDARPIMHTAVADYDDLPPSVSLPPG